MKIYPDNRALVLSQKIYGWLLRAYPPVHRAEYGLAMAQLFRDQCRDAWTEARGWGLLKLWLRVLPDLVKTSIVERLAARRERKYMSDKLAGLSVFQSSPGKVFSRVFVVVFLCIFIGSAAITCLLPDSYASTCRILLMHDGAKSTVNYDPYMIQTEIEAMSSDAVLIPVIDRLNLNTIWGKKYFAGRVLTTSETVEMLRRRLVLRPVQKSMVVAITLVSDDKVEAVQINKSIVDAYRNYRTARSQTGDFRRSQEVNDRLAVLRKQEAQIKTSREELESLGRRLGVSEGATASQSPAEQPYWDAKRKLEELVTAHDGQHKQLQDNLNRAQAIAVGAIFSNVPIIQDASAATTEVRPNRPKNIVMGGLDGILAATLIGGTAAVLVSVIRRRRVALNPTA